MSGVRVLVGTRKWRIRAELGRQAGAVEVSGPHFAGWEIYHLKGSPADPNRAVCVADQRLVRAGDSTIG